MSHLEQAIKKILEETLITEGVDSAAKKIVELVTERGRRKRLSPARLNMLRRLHYSYMMDRQFAAGGWDHILCEALADMGYAEQGAQADRIGAMHYFAITELGMECIKVVVGSGYEMREES